MEKEFEEWYLGNHVEDTAYCPSILNGTVYKLERGFAGTTPAGYLTIYEFDEDDPLVAEQKLAEYQRNPAAFPARLPGNGSLKIVGAGWYAFEKAFHLRG
jgi:hypothetical protein